MSNSLWLECTIFLRNALGSLHIAEYTSEAFKQLISLVSLLAVLMLAL